MASDTPVSQFYENFSQYPQARGLEYQSDRSIRTIKDRLASLSNNIFDNEDRSRVDFCETDQSDHTKFVTTMVQGSQNLKSQLLATTASSVFDPKCRFVFVHARHSRTRLRISFSMMQQLLHYHEVMPSFLEHTLPFKAQHRQGDFHVPRFRSQPCLERQSSVARLSGLFRSGRQLEFCYNLKTAESTGEAEEPWRMRQFSVYHQFDLEVQRSVWIAIKGNEDAKDLIQTRLTGNQPWSIGDSVASSLKFSLKIHLEFCKYSTENWHWFVDALDGRIQESRRALFATIGNFNTQASSPRGVSFTTISTEKTAFGQSKPWLPDRAFTSAPTTMSGRVQSDGSPNIPQQQGCDLKSASLNVRMIPFSFDEIQQAHKIEEKVSNCLLALQANSQMVSQIVREYQNLFDSDHCPEYLKDCQAAIKQFARSIEGISAEFETIQCRVKTLLELTQERKQLLYGILDYQNMLTNQEFAQRSHESARNVEDMTLKMHGIAEKTRIDTASMKTVTTVTLFFLPGTFISTIMSTPIITFKSGTNSIADREVGWGALKLFAVISVPLMVFTFIAWIIVNWVEARKARKRELEGSSV